MFLAVTPLREFWDETDELLFVGPWCVPFEDRAEIEKLKHRFVPDPWSDCDRFIAGVRTCRDITEVLLVQLAERLNAVHGVSHSPRYWRILLNPWLSHHVQQMYNHWIHLEDAFRLEPGLRTVVLDPSYFETPRDMEDFVKLSLGDLYQLQVYSLLLAGMKPGLPARAPVRAPLSRQNMKMTPEIGWPRRAAARALALLTPPGFGDILSIDLNIRSAENRRVYLGSKLKVLPYLAQMPRKLKPAPRPDERRRGLADLKGRDAFERALIAALPVNFPTLYLEGYTGARRHAMGHVWRTPKAIFSAVGWHYNEALKFVAAECSERGSELWGLQHGGVYGLWEQADGEYFERSITDRFYCWGWSPLAHDARVRSLPHPMFARAAQGRPSEDVVVVSAPMDYYDIRLTRPQRSSLAYDYMDREARLCRGLSALLPGRTYFRMNPVDLGWRQRERLKTACPDAQFDDSAVPFSERLRSARLVIFDNPITTFLEALGADRPCLLTWSPSAWRFREESRPFVDRLREAGVLFDDPEAAARQAAAIHADPRAWWDEPARRAAHRAFAEHFALARADWLDAWLKELSAV